MDIQTVLRNMLSHHETKISGQLSFKPGQIFYGTVQKLFPNQHAEIQVGAHKMMAKLEVPLVSGNGYWLQVTSGEVETRLKLLTSGTDSVLKDNGTQVLLKQLSLPDDKKNQVLARFLMNEQIPLSKEEMRRASQFLKQTGDIDGALNTIKLMKEKQMPMNEEVFRSLMTVGKESSTNQLIQSLQTALTSESEISSSGKEILTLLNSWQKESLTQRGHQLFREILQATGEQSAPAQKMIMQSLLQKLNISSGSIDQRIIELAIQKLGLYAKFMQSGTEVVHFPNELQSFVQSLSVAEKEAIQQLVATAEKQYKGEAALQQLKQSLQRTGLFYEGEIFQERSRDILESLKPLLVKYVQETSSTAVNGSRDNAEQLLMRFNGQQLLSFENGPVQQILYEIPIQLGKYQTELTMQWEGKRTSDGQIDPDFCRIIFYLELEHLKETVVEMQVQNRVVTVNIINESPGIKSIAESLVPTLKTGLEQMKYQLSAVHFKQPETNIKQPTKKGYYQSQHSYTGVDIRI
ncbi:hypothetical protein [Lederbergia lenta]|uniref:hypothetical protein n=1 Tax=Lederbergia lenta TaxID=1467 RepID=UPI00203F356E|nr:hypothetical protein [Lederbergia lenta]MCM3110170.1 hypothetical protein [Lederbergia lenta]